MMIFHNRYIAGDSYIVDSNSYMVVSNSYIVTSRTAPTVLEL